MLGTERRENVTTPVGTIQRENFESNFFNFSRISFKNIDHTFGTHTTEVVQNALYLLQILITRSFK